MRKIKGTSDPNTPREDVRSSICDTKTCAKCIYSFSLSGALACDYILATGHRRGCPAGAGCDKRQTGKRKKKAMRSEEGEQWIKERLKT